MFRKVAAWHYKCLKYIDVRLEPVNILIGPNASGKSTLLDLFGFLKDALATDVEEAIRDRGTSLREMVWEQTDAAQGFAIAVEADIPAPLQSSNGYDRLRYEVGVGLDPEGSIVVNGENLWLLDSSQASVTDLSKGPPQRSLFPLEPDDTQTVIRPAGSQAPRGHRVVVRKVAKGSNDYFRSERNKWNISFRLDPRRLSLSGIPEDQERFPSALWFKQFLTQGVQILQLNSVLMRRPSPFDAPRTFQPDGSNLPIIVEDLMVRHPQRFQWWISHLRTILEDLEKIEIRERPEDRSRYLVITYRNGLSVPAWMLSDGTLRLLALTLIAYLPHQDQVFLIEEPENGIHPKAIEAVFKALTSAYSSQIFLATHSPVFLALAKPEHLLIFAKTPNGATDIVRGPDHPILHEWQRETALETLFAAGVLG